MGDANYRRVPMEIRNRLYYVTRGLVFLPLLILANLFLSHSLKFLGLLFSLSTMLSKFLGAGEFLLVCFLRTLVQ